MTETLSTTTMTGETMEMEQVHQTGKQEARVNHKRGNTEKLNPPTTPQVAKPRETPGIQHPKRHLQNKTNQKGLRLTHTTSYLQCPNWREERQKGSS